MRRGGLLGSLPRFLTGFACCVPTVALVLGAQFTLAVIALRSWFFPVAVVAMSASLLWNMRSLSPDRPIVQPAGLHDPHRCGGSEEPG